MAGCSSPLTLAGKVAGGVVGRQVAEVAPAPKTAVVVDPRGGRFCDVMNTQGGPIVLSFDDKLTTPTARRIVGVNEHGERWCNWKPLTP